MQRRRHGITLVELLTVIVIISVMMAILIPAVNRVRETARLATCRSNQKSLSQAILEYETAKGHLPGLLNQGLYGTTTYKYNWVGALMPYIGHNDISQQISTGGTPNATVEVLVCVDDAYYKNNPTKSPLSYVISNQYFLNYQNTPPTNTAGTVVQPTIVSKMPSTTGTVMLCENGSLTNHPGPWNTTITTAAFPALTFPAPTVTPGPIVSTITPPITSPHGNILIMSFFDGHQADVSVDDPFPMP